jgi:hypothetical protein
MNFKTKKRAPKFEASLGHFFLEIRSHWSIFMIFPRSAPLLPKNQLVCSINQSMLIVAYFNFLHSLSEKANNAEGYGQRKMLPKLTELN